VAHWPVPRLPRQRPAEGDVVRAVCGTALALERTRHQVLDQRAGLEARLSICQPVRSGSEKPRPACRSGAVLIEERVPGLVDLGVEQREEPQIGEGVALALENP